MTRNYQPYDDDYDYDEGSRPFKVTMTAVVLVMVILGLIFLGSDIFINAMSGESIEPKEKKKTVQTTEEDQKPLEPKENGDTLLEELPTTVPGQATMEDPDSWKDKTFAFNANANVRTQPGKDNPSNGMATQGDEIAVTDARLTGEVIWVRGTITKAGGKTLEGWVYAPLLNPRPLGSQETSEQQGEQTP